MSRFNITSLSQRSVLYLYTEREEIQTDPAYQRMSDVWTLEKRQLLIDSLLNGYDIPKIYFHKLPREVDGSTEYKWAIIDGKQRLETIWAFIDGVFSIADDFDLVGDSSTAPRGLTYAELGRQFPRLKNRFDATSLDVVVVDTDDEELIEDMFSRLNEAVPLSAAEKRNAFGGPMPKVIRELSQHPFFVDSLPYPNTRYRHYDMVAKFLLIEEKDDVVDTKKAYLDRFVKDWKERVAGQARRPREVTQIKKQTKSVLDRMVGTFADKDVLLRSVGMTVLYYHVFRVAMEEGWSGEVTRARFVKFEEMRSSNRKIAEVDIAEANYKMLEFDRYVQTPNDAYATSLRLEIILELLFEREYVDRGV